MSKKGCEMINDRKEDKVSWLMEAERRRSLEENSLFNTAAPLKDRKRHTV